MVVEPELIGVVTSKVVSLAALSTYTSVVDVLTVLTRPGIDDVVGVDFSFGARLVSVAAAFKEVELV